MSSFDEKFSEFVSEHHNRLKNFVKSKLNANARDHDAEDIVQSVYLDAYSKRDTLRNLNSMKSWLFSIAFRAAINFSAKEARRKKVEEKWSRERDNLTDDSVEKEVEDKDFVDYVLSNVDGECADLLDDFYLKGKLLREIAVERGIPLGTVKRRLYGRATNAAIDVCDMEGVYE